MSSQFFLQLQGIQGDSTDTAHRGWFQFDSMQINFPGTAIGGRSQQGTQSYSLVSLTMAMGPAASRLFAAVRSHQRIANGQIAVMSGNKTNQYKLQDITITSIHTGSPHGSTNPQMHLSLQCKVQSGLHAAQMSHASQASHALIRR